MKTLTGAGRNPFPSTVGPVHHCGRHGTAYMERRGLSRIVLCEGDGLRESPMSGNRVGLIGLGGIILTATSAFAQNTGNPMLSGNTVNPVLSGQTTLLSARSELSVSPSLPTGLLSNTTGTNPLTGLPCTGLGSLSISGAGTLPGSSTPPVNGSAIQTASGTTSQQPAFPSVFQPGGTAGAC